MKLEEFVEELKKLGTQESPENLLWEGSDNEEFKIVHQENGVWESRWGIGRECVLLFPASKPQLLPRFLKVSYETGATEYQEDHPAQTSWVEVYPEEKTIVVYKEKKHDNTKIETQTIPLF